MNKLMSCCRRVKSSCSTIQVKVQSKLILSTRYSNQNIGSLERNTRSFKNLKKVEEIELDSSALILLIFPVTCFGLGCWQIHRRKWKLDLIADLSNRRDRAPVPIPENLDELEGMEYNPVYAKGKFRYDREMYLGPRPLIVNEGKGNVSYGLASQSKTGYLVITPFELSDSGRTILINRGWISMEQFKSKSHIQSRKEGEIELTGIVRLSEKKPQFGVTNKSEINVWVYRDIYKMAEVAKTEPVFIDALASYNLPGGPIGGQTKLAIRNEHLSYIVTWFGLSLATGGLWYMRYRRAIAARFF